MDHARDMTSFIYHYLPLSPLPPSTSKSHRVGSSELPESPYVLSRRSKPARRSDLIGIGHSWSGTASLLAELFLEQARLARANGNDKTGWEGYEDGLWDGLMLIDPMIVDPETPYYQLIAIKRAEDDDNLRLKMTMG